MRSNRSGQPFRGKRPEPTESTAVFPLPKDTASMARSLGSRCQNLGLWLDRFVLYERRGEQWEQSRQSRKRENAPTNLQSLAPLLEACRRRWTAMLGSYGDALTRFTATPEWRVAIGLGGGHVLETGITLHRTYGIPFIPASAVKGVTRAQAFWTIAEDLGLSESALPLLDDLLSVGEKEKEKRQELWKKLKLQQDFDYWQQISRDFYAAFGTTEARGDVVFFDAYPSQVPRLKLDVMNPHYGPYYSDTANRTPPADYHNPVPVYFLTVERTPYQFALSCADPDLRRTAEGWLKEALNNLGIGSKTAAGYGFFQPPS